MITLPGEVVPAWTLAADNFLGSQYVGNWRGLVFPRVTIIQAPSQLWRDWVT